MDRVPDLRIVLLLPKGYAVDQQIAVVFDVDGFRRSVGAYELILVVAVGKGISVIIQSVENVTVVPRFEIFRFDGADDYSLVVEEVQFQGRAFLRKGEHEFNRFAGFKGKLVSGCTTRLPMSVIIWLFVAALWLRVRSSMARRCSASAPGGKLGHLRQKLGIVHRFEGS
jgi:hypothetical protein